MPRRDTPEQLARMQAAKEVREAKEGVAAAKAAYQGSRDEAAYAQAGYWDSRGAVLPANALEELDKLWKLLAACERAEARLEAALKKQDELREETALDREINNLHRAADADAHQRDETASKLRVRANTVGAAIITTSVGILVAVPTPSIAQEQLLLAVHLAAVSGGLFLVEWGWGVFSHQFVRLKRRHVAGNLERADAVPTGLGKRRDEILRNLPWMFAIFQTLLVVASAFPFIKGVLKIAEWSR